MPQLNMNEYDAMQYDVACSFSVMFYFCYTQIHNIWYHHNAYLVLIISAGLCTQALHVSANKYAKDSQLGSCNLHWKSVTYSPYFIS
jgi:hypothetical protein